MSNAPESIGGVLDAGFKLYPGALRVGFVLGVLGSFLSAIPAVVQQRVTAGGGLSLGGQAAFLVLVFLGLIAAAICSAAMIARIDAVANARDMGFAESLRVGVRRAPAFLVSFILFLLATLVGLLLLIVPGFLFGVWFAFGYLSAVVERHGPLQSLGYSKKLTRGHWWRTLVVLGTATMIILVPLYSMVITIVAVIAAWFAASTGMLETLASGTLPWYFNLVISPLLAGVASPLLYALSLAIYYDLRLRREGTDLAARVAAATSAPHIAAAASAPHAATIA